MPAMEFRTSAEEAGRSNSNGKRGGWITFPFIADAFHFPGQVPFPTISYQEFPVSLRSTGTAMISVVIAIAYYVSTVSVDLIRNITGWLPDNINDGRLDNVYCTLVVLGSLNFCYYLICSSLYRYRNVEDEVSHSVSDSNGERAH